MRFTCIILLMFSTAQAAVPQQDSPPIRTIPIPHPLTITLRDHSVHRELKLRTDQVQAVTTAIEEVEGPLWRLRDLPPEQRNPQAESLVEKLRERLRRILVPQQLERLDQIVWQIQGIVSFLEPETAQRLQLSPNQVTQIQNLFTVLTNKLKDLRQNPKIKPEKRPFNLSSSL